MRENWLYPPTASGSYGGRAGRRASGWAGRQADRQAGGQEGRRVGRQVGGQAGGWTGRQTDKMRVGLKIFKILYRSNYLGFYYFNITAMLLQY